MISFDLGFGITVNVETKKVSFVRLDGRINGLELDTPVKEQIEALDKSFDEAVIYLKKKISSKIAGIIKEGK